MNGSGFGRGQRLVQRFGLIALAMVLGSCAPREVADLTLVSAPGTTSQSMFFATQRSEEQLGGIFGEGRVDVLRFGELTVSIPPNHVPGHIEWRSDTPDPAREFAVTRLETTEGISTFAKQVASEQKEIPGEALVFVHGFNTTAAQAVFRLAQIQEDLGLSDPSVLFTWPSAAQSTGYVYDRDSVLFARDDLVTVLSALTQNGNKVTIAGHSMGAHLTMEALRTASLSGRKQLLDRISGVILMSPDIDLDVFDRQADAIGKLPQPFIVLAAEQDRALSISSLLTGRPRLGSTIRSGDLDREDVTVLDFSTYASGQKLDHLVPVTSPAAIEFMQSLVDSRLSDDASFADFLNARTSTGLLGQ